MKKMILFFFLLGQLIPLFSQTDSSVTPRLHLSVFGATGVSINQEFVDENLLTPYHQAFGVKMGWATSGSQDWQVQYQYPVVGVGFIFHRLSEDSRIGNPGSIFTYIELPVIKKRWYSGGFSLQAGLSFFSNKQGLSVLPDNPLLGSKLNAFIGLNYASRFHCSPSLSMLLDLGLSHFSNGRIQTPNPGINLLNATVGLAFHFQKRAITPNPSASSLASYTKANHIAIGVNTGTVTNYIRGLPGYRYLTLSSSIDWIKSYGKKGNFVIGTDLFYDASSGEGSNQRITLPLSNKIFMGLHFGHELKFDKCLVLTQLGFYYIKGSQEKGNIYSRIGLKYQLGKNLWSMIALKTTDGLSADFIEFGLGYSIEVNKKRS